MVEESVLSGTPDVADGDLFDDNVEGGRSGGSTELRKPLVENVGARKGASEGSVRWGFGGIVAEAGVVAVVVIVAVFVSVVFGFMLDELEECIFGSCFLGNLLSRTLNEIK